MCVWMVYYNIKWLCIIVFIQLKNQMAFILHLLQNNTYLFQVWILHATVNLICVHWQRSLMIVWGVWSLFHWGGKNAVIITFFRTKARKWFCHLWGWFNWHVACALEARNLTLFQPFELFRCLIKSFSLHNFLTLILIILLWYFRVYIIM